MPAWGGFLVVTAALTLLVVVLAHLSANALETLDGTTSPDNPDRSDATPNSRARIVETHHDDERLPAWSAPCSSSVEQSTTDERSINRSSSQSTELTTGMVFANVLLTQGAIALVLVVAAWYFSIPGSALGVSQLSTTTALTVALGAGFGIVLWVGNELSTRLADAVGAAYDESVRELLAPKSKVGWIGLFGVVLPLIALSEELLFRAALIGVPAAGTGFSPWLLAVLSSVAFALGHGAQGRVGIVVTGGLGFVLAAGYIVSGSLLLVVVAHYVINAMEFLIHETRVTDLLAPEVFLGART